MTKIKDFEVGGHYSLALLIKEVKNGMTNKGAAYLSMTLADNSGSIEAKMWDVKPEDVKLIQAGRLVQFSFDVLDYKGQLQARVLQASEVEGTIQWEEYVVSSSIPEAVRKQSVQEILSSMKNPVYRQLVQAMLDLVGQKFFDYPAASKIHHAFLGGLSEHSLSMVKVCEELCVLYPQLNRDLLIAGCLVHDLGKTSEMSGAMMTEYTVEGKLEGHISIANGWLTQVANELDLDSSEECMLLHHMILSHHGHLEYGSPVLPCTQEAEILSLVDNIDARMNTLKAALKDVEPGSWSTRLFALDNRQFYKPKEK